MPLTKIIDAMRSAEQVLDKRIKSEQGVLRDIEKTRSQLSKGIQPIAALRRLENLLRETAATALPDEVTQLNNMCSEAAASMAGVGVETAIHEIRAIAEKLSWAFRPLGEDVVFGPFILKLDGRAEMARLQFAKVDVAQKLPLVSSAIEDAATRIAKSILSPVGESAVGKLAAEFEEAIRVAIARAKQPFSLGDLRAELPAVYREMGIIRQNARGTGKIEDMEGYPLARFVVEVKGLVASEFNTTQERRFKLEPAVIENTRNPKKSLFLPKNLDDGGGEGTYYQAIVLLARN